MNNKLDQYVEKGLYGAKETKRAERRQYLGTLRERIVLALTKSQVRRKEGLDQLEKEIKQNQGTRLLLNGELNSRFLTDYKKLADRYGTLYTTVSNREAKTDIGVVLAYDHAIDKEEIFYTPPSKKETNKPETEQQSFLERLKKLFKRKA